MLVILSVVMKYLMHTVRAVVHETVQHVQQCCADASGPVQSSSQQLLTQFNDKTMGVDTAAGLRERRHIKHYPPRLFIATKRINCKAVGGGSQEKALTWIPPGLLGIQLHLRSGPPFNI